MRGNRAWLLALTILGVALHCGPGFAQTLVSEDFTGTTTNSPWYYFNGACLTASTAAGTGTSGSVAGTPPGCTANTYYGENLVGGYNGVAGSAATLPDPVGYGALRFTNGCIYSSSSDCSNGGHDQNGAIISANTYSTDQGLDITFKTVTYRGDSGGNSAGCPSGSSESNGECVATTTTSPTESYSCSSGTLSGSNCTGVTVTASATESYSCSSGYTPTSGVTKSTTCSETVTTSPTDSRGSYSCPSGYTPTSGVNKYTTCSETETASPTASYSCPSGYSSSGSGSSMTCSKTETVAATASYSCPSGYTSSGSGSSMTCTETTVVTTTDPHQTDGADGMSFFLMNGATNLTSDPTEDAGSYGGSLGYSCSNTNDNETEPYHGMVGAYLGLGIDEFGNFLNGEQNTLGVTDPQALGDNTASGGGQWANRIGLRGAGNIAWDYLTATYPSDYPPTLSSSNQDTAVQDTCETGTIWNFSNANSPTNTGTAIMDYPAIPGAYTVISSTIANEYATGGYSRQAYSTTSGTYGTGANPITYELKITDDGLLSLSYSYNGGAWTSVIKDQSITSSNGALPSTVRFGFAGSTGGNSNIHEVLCFQATPVSQASSSTTVNQQQSSKVETGSQAYFGYYDPQNWTGDITANSLINTNGVLTISTTANWDASCVLTGVASGSSCATTGQGGPIAAQSPATGSGGRVMLTWSGTAGIPFEWSSITSAEQTDLTAGDASATSDRLAFLRGDMTNEVNTSGTCPAAGSGLPCFRVLDSVLGDIIDSSSTWVGPPSMSPYVAYETPATWADRLYPGATMPENSGQSYTTYSSDEATRQNVVYVGANDGFLHGFSAGSWNGSVYDSATDTGQELIAYMPEGVLETIHNATNASIDYPNTQYGHNFYVDATPGTGDLYYDGGWHTWLVGGLGPGGAEIYALDITTPANFSESNASTLVMGDWMGGTSASNPGSFTCQYVTNCALNLGDTYGTPAVRRLHNGDWAIIFGNGLNSSTGDAGIFILTVNPTSGAQTMYYLSTGESGKSDGIAYANPVDMDGDHVVDYVYAGDALGNVWRFDLTSSNPQSWAVTPGPLFTTSSGQPITSDVYPVFAAGPSGTQLMLFFGTGEKFPLTETSAASYSTGQQAFYGVWDWNMSAWNALNSTQFASMPAGTMGTLTPANLQQQTVAYSGTTVVETASTICWAGTSTCSSNNNQYGWYMNFPGTSSGYGTTTYEQEIYNPTLVSTAIQFNTILPAINSPLMCTADQNQGWSYAVNVLTGGPEPGFFVNNGNTTTLNGSTIALQLNASGTSSLVTTQTGTGATNTYLIYQSLNGGAGTPQQVTPANNVTGYRETWIQLR